MIIAFAVFQIPQKRLNNIPKLFINNILLLNQTDSILKISKNQY